MTYSSADLQTLLDERLRLRQEITVLRAYGHGTEDSEQDLRDLIDRIRRLQRRRSPSYLMNGSSSVAPPK